MTNPLGLIVRPLRVIAITVAALVATSASAQTMSGGSSASKCRWEARGDKFVFFEDNGRQWLVDPSTLTWSMLREEEEIPRSQLHIRDGVMLLSRTTTEDPRSVQVYTVDGRMVGAFDAQGHFDIRSGSVTERLLIVRVTIGNRIQTEQIAID